MRARRHLAVAERTPPRAAGPRRRRADQEMDRPTAIRQTRTRAPTHPTPPPITMDQPATRRRANPEAPNRPAPATRALRSTPTVGRRVTPGPAATAPRLRVPRPKTRRVVATAEPEAPRS